MTASLFQTQMFHLIMSFSDLGRQFWLALSKISQSIPNRLTIPIFKENVKIMISNLVNPAMRRQRLTGTTRI